MSDQRETESKPDGDELEYPRELLDAVLDAGPMKEKLTEQERLTWHALINTAFFASLHSEEGTPVRFSVVWLQGGAKALRAEHDSTPVHSEDELQLAWDVVALNPSRLFGPHELRKLSKGLAYGRQAIVVGGSEPGLKIEGVGSLRPNTDGGTAALRFHVIGPGQIIFETNAGEVFAFDRGVLAPRGEQLHGIPAINEALVRISEGSGGTRFAPFLGVLPRLLQRMRNTGNGALLAILPEAPNEKDLAADFYRLADPDFLRLRAVVDEEARSRWMVSMFSGAPAEEQSEALRQRDAASEDLKRALDLVGRLSAIDGAVLAGPRVAIYGAGYIIGATMQPTRLPVLERRPKWLGDRPLPRVGARHDAACRFAEMHPTGLAFVVSEDGPVKCAIHAGDHIDLWQLWMPQFELW